MPSIFRKERMGQRGLVTLSLMLVLVLTALADPATADDFTPTEFGQRPCETEKRLDALESEYAAAQVVFFGGAKEDHDFGTARVSGHATWQTTFYEGPARDQEIKAALWQIKRGAWTSLSAIKGGIE